LVYSEGNIAEALRCVRTLKLNKLIQVAQMKFILMRGRGRGLILCWCSDFCYETSVAAAPRPPPRSPRASCEITRQPPPYWASGWQC